MDIKAVNSPSLNQSCRMGPPSLVSDRTSKQSEFTEHTGNDESSYKLLRHELEQANARAARAEVRLRCMSHGIRAICNEMKQVDYCLARSSLNKQQASFSEEEEDATTISTSDDSQTIASSSSGDSIPGSGCIVSPPRSRTLSETALYQSGSGEHQSGSGEIEPPPPPRARTYSGTACNVFSTSTSGGPFCGTINVSEIMPCPLQLPVQMTTFDTSDLLALQNAAHMIQQHIKLAAMEAAVAVQDTVRAQSATQEWRKRALDAEKALLKMHQENKDLKSSNEKLAAERRILVKEIRKMRKQVAPMDSKQLESFVVNALTFHEKQLKMNKNKGKEQIDDDGDLVGGRSETSTVADTVSANGSDKNGSAAAAAAAGEATNTMKKTDDTPPSPLQVLELKKLEHNFRAPIAVSATVNRNPAPSTTTTTVAFNARRGSGFAGGAMALGFGSFRVKHAFAASCGSSNKITLSSRPVVACCKSNKQEEGGPTKSNKKESSTASTMENNIVGHVKKMNEERQYVSPTESYESTDGLLLNNKYVTATTGAPVCNSVDEDNHDPPCMFQLEIAQTRTTCSLMSLSQCSNTESKSKECDNSFACIPEENNEVENFVSSCSSNHDMQQCCHQQPPPPRDVSIIEGSECVSSRLSSPVMLCEQQAHSSGTNEVHTAPLI